MMQITLPDNTDFSVVGGGGGGDSGGQGAVRAPRSKWNISTHETSLVTLGVHFQGAGSGWWWGGGVEHYLKKLMHKFPSALMDPERDLEL